MKLRGLRWWMIGLLMLGSILNYLTRSTLAVAATQFKPALHITDQQYSWIVGTFQGTIMLQPAAGWSMIAPWKAPTIHEYCRSVMWSAGWNCVAATASVLRVR